MLRYLIVLIFIFSSLAQAKDFPVDYMEEFQSKNIDLSSSEWIVAHPTPNRMFLVHQRLKTFALITEHISDVPVEKMEEYFAGPFTNEALLSREKFLKNESGVLDLDGGSDTHSGHRYGGVAFKVMMDEGIARFHERMWGDNGKLWHVSLVSFEATSQDSSINAELNFLMEKITKAPVHTSSIFNFLIPEAHAAVDARCRINEEGSWRQLAGLVPKVKREARCNVANIPAANRGNSSGIKLNLSSLNGCVQGPPAAWNAMKQGFLSGLNTLANATQKRIQSMGCERLKPPEAKTMWQSITNSFAMQAYTDCLTTAATTAMVSQAYQAVKSTLGGIRDLYNWVKAGNNPWSAAVAIVSKEVKGFLCLNAAAQAKVVCEYATHFFIAMGVVAATAATGGALAPVAGAGAAARVAIAMNRGVAAARAFVTTPYTVTRTIVKAPGSAAKKVAGLSVREAARSVRVPSVPSMPTTQQRNIASNTSAPSVKPKAKPKPKAPSGPSAPASEKHDDDRADVKLNKASLRVTNRANYDATLRTKGLSLTQVRARVDEVGIEEFLEEKGSLFTSSEKARMIVLHNNLHPEPSAPVPVAVTGANPVNADPKKPAPVPFPTATATVTATVTPFDKLANYRKASSLTPLQRSNEAQSLLARPLTIDQKKAIYEAQKIGNEAGHGYYSYTNEEISAKSSKLKNAGFTPDEIRTLMEKGIIGELDPKLR